MDKTQRIPTKYGKTASSATWVMRGQEGRKEESTHLFVKAYIHRTTNTGIYACTHTRASTHITSCRPYQTLFFNKQNLLYNKMLARDRCLIVGGGCISCCSSRKPVPFRHGAGDKRSMELCCNLSNPCS